MFKQIALYLIISYSMIFTHSFGFWFGQNRSTNAKASLKLISKYSNISKNEFDNGAFNGTVNRTLNGILGVVFTMEPGWHIYWNNPGDSGLPPKFTWIIPKVNGKDMLKVGEVVWPYPKKIVQEDSVTYGYSDEVLLMFPIELSKFVNENNEDNKDKVALNRTIKIEVLVEYLICKDVCIPESKKLQIELPIVHAESAESTLKIGLHVDLFLTYEKKIPIDGSKWLVNAHIDGKHILLDFDKRLFDFPGWSNGAVFFPNLSPDNSVLSSPGAFILNEIKEVMGENYFTVSLPVSLSESNTKVPEELLDSVHGMLVPKGSSNANNVHSNDALNNTVNTHPQTATRAIYIKTIQTQDNQPIENALQLLLYMLYAFLGGVILNAMPCVFPVLSLKAMSIANMGDHKRERFKHGVFFSVGIIVTFLVLALMILILQQGGKALGWGFHLQSPIFVALMIFLFTAMAINFLGWYEVGLQVATVSGKRMGADINAFSSGIISTLVATPCTAPFMGTALGFALTTGWLETLAIFICLGLGMASPFFVLCVFPITNTLLPKPGAWMNTFKHAMAFPLLGTVLWLFWVWQNQLESQMENQSTLFLVLLLVFSFGLWLYGRGFQLTINKRLKYIWLILSVGLIVYSLHKAVEISGHSRINKKVPHTSGEALYENGLKWEPFKKEQLQRYITQKRPVLIDFTASWCITCQVNKKVAFTPSEIKNEINKKGVVLMRADWTEYDPNITEALAEYGRRSIPLNVLHLPNQTKPELLPEVLTPSILKHFLDKIP